MTDLAIEYHLLDGQGWLFGLVAPELTDTPVDERNDPALRLTGYHLWRLPFEIAAQMAWRIMRMDVASSERMAVCISNPKAQVRDFYERLEDSDSALSTFVSEGQSRRFVPSGLADLRELLRFDTMPATVLWNDGTRLEFSMSRSGWFVSSKQYSYLDAARSAADHLGIVIRPFDELAALLPQIQYLDDFDP